MTNVNSWQKELIIWRRDQTCSCCLATILVAGALWLSLYSQTQTIGGLCLMYCTYREMCVQVCIQRFEKVPLVSVMNDKPGHFCLSVGGQHFRFLTTDTVSELCNTREGMKTCSSSCTAVCWVNSRALPRRLHRAGINAQHWFPWISILGCNTSLPLTCPGSYNWKPAVNFKPQRFVQAALSDTHDRGKSYQPDRQARRELLP